MKPLRTELDLAAAQLSAIERFSQARRARELASEAAARTREVRMDVTRQLEVLRRQQEALVARSHAQLARSGGSLFTPSPVRAVLAHRSAWFVERVAAALRESCVEVVATPANGADAVGIAVAEQPDIVLVEDSLEMLAGEEVVRDVRQFCPETIIVAQVAYGDRVGALLDAGAATVFTRQVPPVDVVAQLRDLIGPLEA